MLAAAPILFFIPGFGGGTDAPSFRKLTKIDSHGGDTANLEAVGKGLTLKVSCGRIGTSVTIDQKGKGYSYVIAKGSLASVSYSNKTIPILKLLAIIALLYGLVEDGGAVLDDDLNKNGFHDGYEYYCNEFDTVPTTDLECEGGYSPSIGFIGAAILFIAYLMTQSAQLSLESKGGKEIAVSFTRSAARRAEELGKFCSAAVMIDTGQSIKGLLDGIDLEEMEREAEAFANSSEDNGGSPAVAFSDIDTDGDGSISQGEFVAAVGSDEVLFSQMDADGDGEISQEEFDEFDDF